MSGMKYHSAIAMLVACSLCGCTSTINMPLDHAKLADGYVNSSTLAFGHVLVWDTSTDRVESIFRIIPQMVPTASVDSGPRFGSKASAVSRDTNLDISVAPGVSQAAQGAAAVQFINSTEVSLTNFNPLEYRDASYVLNSPELRVWRQSLTEEYTEPRYRFIFVSRVTNADELSIGRKASGAIGADANVVQVGQYKFKVTYGEKSSVTIKGEQAPLTVDPAVFTFRVQGNSYRFYRDLSTVFDFQTLKRG